MTHLIRRTLPDLVAALRRHTRLLLLFAEQAFAGRDYDFLGEVAAKLRLLVSERGSNKPLLLRLMDEFQLDIPIQLDGPGGARQMSLRGYLELDAYHIKTESRGFVGLSKIELFRIWAQQHGAAHEDWQLREEFAIARDSDLFLGGQPALAAELKTTTNTVLYVAETVLSELTPEVVEVREREVEGDS